jgi:hypothetical protein
MAASQALFAKHVQVCVRLMSTLPVQTLLHGTCVPRLFGQLRQAEKQCGVTVQALADQLWGVAAQQGPVDISYDTWFERVTTWTE